MYMEERLKLSNHWDIFFIETEGKKRTAHDIIIPRDLKESEIVGYLEDLLHEWATLKNNSVLKL